MQVRIRSLPIAALAVLAALCLFRIEPAWAGDGGEDAGTVQSFLDGVCSFVGQSPCPQLPTVSQGMLEIAGLFNARPEAVRAGQGVPGGAVYAGNVATEPPAALASLTPLAFKGAMTSRGQAIADAALRSRGQQLLLRGDHARHGRRRFSAADP